MPELPEVETIRRGLIRGLLHKKIKTVEVRKPKLVRGALADFQKALVGAQFLDIDRRGKLLAFQLPKQQWMLLHLKMTGQLIYEKSGEFTVGGHSWPRIDKLPNKYSHIIFSFADKSHLYFNDQRQFGYVQLVNDEQKKAVWEEYGLEPLGPGFTKEKFLQQLNRRKGLLKAVLLDQKLFAGIGNIYADETCFTAKIKPSRMISSLTHKEKESLYEAARDIIKLAIKHRGTTFSDYRDSNGKQGGFAKLLNVYGRSKKSCPRCKTGVIQKVKLAGRGTHFCNNCQK